MNQDNRLVLALAAAAVFVLLALVIGVVLLLDPGGWGNVLTELILSAALQLLIGGVLLGLLLAVIYMLFRRLFASFTRRPVLTGRFLSTMLMSLSLLPLILVRPLFLYDPVVTVMLALVFFMAYDLLRDAAACVTGQALPPRAQTSQVVYEFFDDSSAYDYFEPEPIVPASRGYSTQATRQRGTELEEALYFDLLERLNGDTRELEDMVEYERSYAPYASRAELLRRALERLENNNHQV